MNSYIVLSHITTWYHRLWWTTKVWIESNDILDDYEWLWEWAKRYLISLNLSSKGHHTFKFPLSSPSDSTMSISNGHSVIQLHQETYLPCCGHFSDNRLWQYSQCFDRLVVWPWWDVQYLELKNHFCLPCHPAFGEWDPPLVTHTSKKFPSQAAPQNLVPHQPLKRTYAMMGEFIFCLTSCLWVLTTSTKCHHRWHGRVTAVQAHCGKWEGQLLTIAPC